MVSASKRIFSVAFLASLAWSAAATGTCFNPDGSRSADLPCSSTAEDVFCCPAGSKCISDPGPLCQLQNNTFVRGTCTVETWSSSACPLFCLAIDGDNRVDKCTTQVAAGQFCCGYDADKDLCSCATNNNTFHLGDYTVSGISSMSSTPVPTRSSSSPSASASASASSSSAGIIVISLVSSNSDNSTASSTVSQASASSNSSTQSTTSVSTTHSTASTVSKTASGSSSASTGAGPRATAFVGGLFGVGAIGAAGFLL